MTEALFDEPPVTGATTQDRQWAMFAHLSALIAMWFGYLGFLGPLIVWLIKKSEMPYVDQQGKEAINFQLNMLGLGIILGIAAIPIGILTLGIGLLLIIAPLGVALLIYSIVMPIIAAVSCNAGEAYRYPYVYRILKW
jgi:uncharacterized Tic20 family protein